MHGLRCATFMAHAGQDCVPPVAVGPPIGGSTNKSARMPTAMGGPNHEWLKGARFNVWEGDRCLASGHLRGRGFCRVRTSPLAGGAHDWLRGTFWRFGLHGDCHLVRRSTAAVVAPKGKMQ